jgi:hypothetical protein
VEPLVKVYKAQGGTRIKLTILPQADFVTKFATAAGGGAGPDSLAADLVFRPASAQSGQRPDLPAGCNSFPFAKSLCLSHLRLAREERHSVRSTVQCSGLCGLNWTGVRSPSLTDAKPYRRRFPLSSRDLQEWLYPRAMGANQKTLSEGCIPVSSLGGWVKEA